MRARTTHPNQPTVMPTATQGALDVSSVALVILAGIVAALHVGKGPIAMPEMQHDFGHSLSTLSWVMSVFAIVGVLGSTAAGVLAQRLGDRRVLMGGLLILGVASFAGSGAPSFGWLVATRVVEGLGFLMVVVAAPAAINRLTPPARRKLVFGFWGSFMGIGMAVSMLLGPQLGHWPRLWMVDGALALLMTALVGLRVPAAPRVRRPVDGELRSALRSRPTALLALGFAVYNMQFFALMSFLPSFLMQRVGLSMGEAGIAGASIVIVNAVGNVAGGAALQRGIDASRLLMVASIVTGVLGLAAFLPAVPSHAAIGLCVAFSACAGALPATFLACAPHAAPAPHLAPMSLGIVMQGNYLGQLVAPVQAGMLLASVGWVALGLQIVAAGVVGALIACLYGRSVQTAAARVPA